MNTAAKAAASLLLSALLAGCWHRHKATPPAAAMAPAVPLSEVANNVPPPFMPTPQLPNVIPPTMPPVNPAPVRKPVHHPKPKHVTIPATPAQPAPKPRPTPEQIANGVPTDMSPIGQLSAAGESTNLTRRHQIVDEIDSTEKGLNKIARPLSKDEQTTVIQIRTFLEKARQALNRADLDGAHTLVIKARVLLKEIARS